MTCKWCGEETTGEVFCSKHCYAESVNYRGQKEKAERRKWAQELRAKRRQHEQDNS